MYKVFKHWPLYKQLSYILFSFLENILACVFKEWKKEDSTDWLLQQCSPFWRKITKYDQLFCDGRPHIPIMVFKTSL
jgi:hypothetical protein